MSSNPYNAPLQTGQTAQPGGLRMLHIKQIDVISFGLLNGAFGICIGLVVGVVFGAITVVGAMAGGNAVAGIFFGIGAIILAPALYGMGAFIGGCVGALIYNFVAGMVGGVRIQVEV